MIDKFNYIKICKIEHQKTAKKKVKNTSHIWGKYV